MVIVIYMYAFPAMMCCNVFSHKGRPPICAPLKFSFLILHFSLFSRDWDTIQLFLMWDLDAEIYFKQPDLSRTYFVSVLQMKPFPFTVHCFLICCPYTYFILIDPKRDIWSPELMSLTSSLILPHVPEMKRLIFFCLICMYVYKWPVWSSVFMCSCPLLGNTSWKKWQIKWCYRDIVISVVIELMGVQVYDHSLGSWQLK